MLRYKPKSSLALQKIRQSGDTGAQTMYKNKKPVWTKFVFDSRKNGNSTNFFGSTCLAMGKRFQLQLFKEYSLK